MNECEKRQQQWLKKTKKLCDDHDRDNVTMNDSGEAWKIVVTFSLFLADNLNVASCGDDGSFLTRKKVSIFTN